MLTGRVKAAVSRLPERRQRQLKILFGVTAGAVLGYAYYALIGCSTGTCPITSNPYVSTGWGALIGLSITAG